MGRQRKNTANKSGISADVKGKQDIEEEDLVRPDQALLLRLWIQPGRPLVRDELELKAKLL